jgi:mRNA interferase MazF
MVGKYIPDRGDIVMISFDPQTGHEIAGNRPAVVISPVKYNTKTGLGVFCPVTSRVKGYPFEVVIPEGLPITGAIITDQMKSLDWRVRKVKFVCKVPRKVIGEVMMKLRALLGD